MYLRLLFVAALASAPSVSRAQDADEPVEREDSAPVITEAPSSNVSPDVVADEWSTEQEGNEWGPPPGEVEDDDGALDARLSTLDAYLKDVQSGQRRYFASWLILSGTLIGGSTYFGLNEDTPGVRAGWFTSVALSTTSLGLLFLRRGPGLRMHSRFARMPDDSTQQKRAKVAAGEKLLAAMANKDKRATSYIAHLLGAGAAGASAVGLSLAYSYNLKEGLRRLFGTLLVSELIILSRPVRSIAYYERYSTSPKSVQLAVAPWSDGRSYGFGLSGRF
ncbi:MAG: hypothetical protein ABW352_04040 [Polyangiales bacterium]